MSLQMARFHAFWWLIFPCVCVYTHTYIYIHTHTHTHTHTYIHTTSSLSIHQSMDIWALSILWLLSVVLLYLLGCMCPFETAYLYPLDKYLVVQLLGHRVVTFLIFFLIFIYLFKKIFFNIYSFLRQGETEHERGRVRERGRHRIGNRLQAPSCQHRARGGARTHGPRDRDLSRSWTLNRLSHPGAPQTFPLSAGVIQ